MMVLYQFAVSPLETLRERSLQFPRWGRCANAVMKRLLGKNFGLTISRPNLERWYNAKFAVFLLEMRA